MGRVGPVWPGHVSLTGVTTWRVWAPTGPLVHQAWLIVDSHARRMDRRTSSRWAQPTAPSSLSWSTADLVHMGAAPLFVPSPKLLCPHQGVPAGGERAVGRLLVKSFSTPSPFFDWGKAGPVECGTEDRSAWWCPRAAVTSEGAPVVPRP
jgi:hypothetical protein